MRILSVDDNADNLHLIEMIARRHAHSVVSAHNGTEALDKLAAGTFDLIVSDVLMPDMDGYQLCRTVKSDERLKQIPFIFYTATYTSEKDEELGLMLGASRFIVKPVNPEEFMTVLEQVVHEGETGKLPVAVVHLDDSDKSVSIYSQCLVRKLEHKIEQLEKARVELAASIDEKNREIAQRRLAQQDLLRSEEQLRMMCDGSLDGMQLSDHDGIILWANPALARMFAKPLGSLPGQLFTCCYGVDDSKSMLAAYRKQVQSRTIEAHFEMKLRRWDGEDIWVEGTNATLVHPSGPAVFSVLRDETQRKRSEQEQASLEQQLWQSQKLESVGQLAGSVAHDFNNLLTVILGYSDIVLAGMNLEDPSRDAISQISAAANRAAGLTRQLLTFSRWNTSAAKTVSLHDIISGIQGMLERLIGEHIEVVVSSGAASGFIHADPGLIEQVILNLAVNARDAMPGGGKLLIDSSRVTVADDFAAQVFSVPQGTYVSLGVTDTGTGMTPEVQARMFEPFFTTKEQGKGTGLGLSTVFGIVKQSGGSITVHSTPGIGTAFRVLFPAVVRAGTEKEGQTVETFAHGTETVLLVAEIDAAIPLLQKPFTPSVLLRQMGEILKARICAA